MKALIKRLFGIKDTPELFKVKKYKTYEDLGECAKSLHNLVVNNPKRFRLKQDGSIGELNTPTNIFEGRLDIVTRFNLHKTYKVWDAYNICDLQLHDKETDTYFIVNDKRDSWESSGLCNKVSYNEWVLLKYLLIVHYERCIDKYNEALWERKYKQRQRIKKRYNDLVSKLYCTCESTV